MLRITRLAPHSQIPQLRVEGRLVGDWVRVLQLEIEQTEGSPLTLDLSGVEFADQGALALLRELTQRGVELMACSPLLTSLLASKPS
jgi:hypothetical protein